MTAASSEPTTTHTEVATNVPDWSALRLFNQYRLLVILALAAVYYLSDNQRTLGSRNSDLFEVVHLAYLVLTLASVLLMRLRRPSLTTQFLVQNYVDILLISCLMYASGGVDSGLGPLLLINLAIFSQLAAPRHAMLFAAIASIIVLVEELMAQLLLKQQASFEATALLGVLLFTTAWVLSVPLRNLVSRQVLSPTRSRVGLDVQQIAQLNEEIIRELDSGVVVVDANGEVQLINDTARALLAAEFLPMPVHVKRLCRELADNLQASRYSATEESRPFNIGSTGVSVLPQYIQLSNGGMLVKLDDHAHIRKQFQQLKLASLGRLSASIAHEIRNPLGAISHAVQLIQESPTIDDKDAELLLIAKRHTQRINRIIEDVLQLSNRQQVSTEVVSVDQVIIDFAKRYAQEQALNEDRIQVSTEPSLAIIDPIHLDQVLWNLCTNAHLHNNSDNLQLHIRCWETERGTTIIDVEDNGKGISDMDREKLFEPFYSTHHAGTGLGLFIIRELCSLNKALIECLPCPTGAHFRVTLSSAQDMAA